MRQPAVSFFLSFNVLAVYRFKASQNWFAYLVNFLLDKDFLSVRVERLLLPGKNVLMCSMVQQLTSL